VVIAVKVECEASINQTGSPEKPRNRALKRAALR
jgi:hypothetical protein